MSVEEKDQVQQVAQGDNPLESEEYKQFLATQERTKKALAVEQKIAELEKDPATKVLIERGLGEELREFPVLMDNPEMLQKKIQKYAKTVLTEHQQAQSAAATQTGAAKVYGGAPAKPAPVDANGNKETYSPAEKTVDELMAMGYSREDAFMAKAFPPRQH